MAPRGRKPLAKTWRQRGCPGINAPVPPGGHGIAASAGVIGRDKLARRLRTFDNTRDVAELAPYGEAAEGWLEAAAAQLGVTFGGESGPMELAILRGAAEQMFWAQVFFDRARAAMGTADGKDPKLGDVAKLAETATRITDSYRANILAANKLRAERAASEDAAAPARNPLAAYDMPLEPEPQ